MKYIYSYMIISLPESNIGELSRWLESAHAMFAADFKTGRLIVFNISDHFLERLLSLFSLNDWIYSTCDTPDEYVELFRHVNYCIEQNLMAYKRCFSNDPAMDNTSPGIRDIEIMKRAFSADDYREWRRRFYLTRNIRAIDAHTFAPVSIENDDELSTASGLIAGRAHDYWEYPSYYPDADISATLRIDPDGKKAMIGWFIDNDHFMEYNIDCNALRLLTNRMKSWLSEMNITNNAHNPEEVNSILRAFDIDRQEYPKHNYRNIDSSRSSLINYRHINNFIIIDSATLPESLISWIGNGHAYAYDHKNGHMIIFNMDDTSLLFLLSQEGISRVAYSPQNEIKAYENLFEYVDKQMEINKNRPQTIGHYISSANSYVRQQMNIASLKGIDANIGRPL